MFKFNLFYYHGKQFIIIHLHGDFNDHKALSMFINECISHNLTKYNYTLLNCLHKLCLTSSYYRVHREHTVIRSIEPI